jgi:site-specific DNA recombinase
MNGASYERLRAVKSVRRRGHGRFSGTKNDVLMGGASITYRDYNRASAAVTTKSVDDQRRENQAVGSGRYGWAHGGSYADNDIGASERTDAARRGDWVRLIEDLKKGRPCDVLVFTDISRETRDLAVFVEINNLCLELGLYFWMVGGNLYDLRLNNDQLALNIQAVFAQYQSNTIMTNLIRTLKGNADDGVPHGKAAFGYTRRYDPRTGRYATQHPDHAMRVSPAGHTWSPADVVKGIYRRLLLGHALTEIAETLELSGVPTPRALAAVESEQHPGGSRAMPVGRWDGTGWTDRNGQARRKKKAKWTSKAVRDIALNPANIGQRWTHGDGDEAPRLAREECWPRLVEPDEFYAVRNMLLDPRRKTGGPSQRAITLLVGIATCGVCGSTLTANNNPKAGAPTYKCRGRRGCCTASQDPMNRLVERYVLDWLTDRANLDRLSAISSSGSAEAAEARAEVEKILGLLAAHGALLDTGGDVDLADHTRLKRGMEKRLAEAQLRARTIGLAAALQPFVDATPQEAATVWSKGTLAFKRNVLRNLLTVVLHPSGRRLSAHHWHGRPLLERLEIMPGIAE